jgi:integrase
MSTNDDAVAALIAGLRALGATPEQVVAAFTLSQTPSLSVAEYLPKVEAAAADGSVKTYAPYWRRLVTALGETSVAAVTVTDLETIAKAAQANAVTRRNERGGRSAKENCVAAMRFYFARAKADGVRRDNPALEVAKPRRLPSPRRPLTDHELADLWRVTTSGGNDPKLDALLLRFHLETGARRGGALAMRVIDVDRRRLLVRLREKGDTIRWQPVSRTLMDALVAHAAARGAVNPTDAVFRYRPVRPSAVGAPLTRRRYNTLADRWQRELSWAAKDGVSPHWLRHTSIAAVERIAGFGVAKQFAGHISGEVTTTYITASASEVADAVALLTGENHPLASSRRGDDRTSTQAGGSTER